jgi:hypothetical protein
VIPVRVYSIYLPWIVQQLTQGERKNHHGLYHALGRAIMPDGLKRAVPRSKPRTEEEAAAAAPHDKTPDDLFIKVYPKRLRELVRYGGLTRAQLGALLMLALRIDEDNRCWPSRDTAAKDANRSNGRHTARMHRLLIECGVLMVDEGDESPNQSHMFILPDAFEYGSRESNEDENVTKTRPQGVRKTRPLGSGKPDGGGLENQTRSRTKQAEPEEEESVIRKAAAFPNTTMQQPTSPAINPLDLQQRLISAGVKLREAALIAHQYHAETINGAIADAQRKAAAGEIGNPGGWIAAAIQARANEKIRYPAKEKPNHAARQQRPPVPGAPPKPHRPW